MMEEVFDLQMQTDKHVQIYGDDMSYNSEEEVFEGYKLAVDDSKSLMRRSMRQDELLTEEKVENYMAQASA